MVGDIEEVDGQLVVELTKILSKFSMRPKYTATSGKADTRALEKMGGHVLGHTWDPPEDKIMVKLEVGLASKKTKGNQKLVTMDNIDDRCDCPDYPEETCAVNSLQLV